MQMSKSHEYQAAMSQSPLVDTASNAPYAFGEQNVQETQVIVPKVPKDVVPNHQNVVPRGVVPRPQRKIKSIVVEGPGAVNYVPKLKKNASRKGTESMEDSQMYAGNTLGNQTTLVGYDEMVTSDGSMNNTDEWTAGFIGDGSITHPANLSAQANKTINAFKLRQLRDSMVAEDKPLPETFDENEGFDTGAKEVAEWLHSIKMDAYYNSFVNSGFNTLKFVQQIDDMSYLEMLDPPITNLAHRLLIFKNIMSMTGHAGDV